MTKIWELDFYSRPILDENQKKVWEIAICESPTIDQPDPAQGFRYTRYCANTEVNSLTLRQALGEAIDKAGYTPSKVRFFRQSMKNAIVRGCEDAGLPVALSHRTYTLKTWLNERLQSVYPQEPGYAAHLATAGMFLPPPAAQPMPDALLGQKWGFVTLPAIDFADLADWPIDFGETFPLAGLGLRDETRIPGVVIWSPRATAIAAWMSGLELGFLTIEQQTKPSSLSSNQTEFPDQAILETGVGDRWIFANLPEAALKSEAQNFQAAKASAHGVHFLAVQTTPESERFAGFWLMREAELPGI